MTMNKKDEKIMEDAALKVVVFATGHPEVLPVINATQAALKVVKKRRRARMARCPRAGYRKPRGLAGKLLGRY